MITSVKGTAKRELNEFKIGITFDIQNENSLLLAINSLIDTPVFVEELSNNARDLYLKKFEHTANYNALVDYLEDLNAKKKYS
jgi:hypothetical protein